MAKYTLDYDPETKIRSVLHTDLDGPEEMVIESIQDADDIIDFNAKAAEKFDKRKDWWLIGSIPLTLCQQWARESATKVFTKEWQEYAKKQMNDPDYAKLNQNRIKL